MTPKPRRTRASAKAAGTSFETLVATYLADALEDDRIERRTLGGAKDRGDITGVRAGAHRVVIECKNSARLNLGPWITEAEQERINDKALIGVVAHKRHGKGQPEDQYVTMTLETFTQLLELTQ